MQTFAYASADLFLKTDLDGNITFAEGAARLLRTVDARSLILCNLFQLLNVSDIGVVRARFTNLRPGERASLDDPGFAPDGRRIIFQRSKDAPACMLVTLADMAAHEILSNDKVEEHHVRAFRSALAARELKAARQPIVCLETGHVSHYEMLVRFPFSESPGPMIAAAEKRGMIAELDCIMLDAAAARLSSPSAGALKLAVNLSGETLQRMDVVRELIRILERHAFKAGHLILEITESCEIHDVDTATTAVDLLRDHGAQVVLDDFGAGAASFGYLRSLNVDGIKFDGCFLATAVSSQRNTALMRNIARMCGELGMTVVGERVETEQDRQILIDAGVPMAQGYFFGRPEIDEEFFAARNQGLAAA